MNRILYFVPVIVILIFGAIFVLGLRNDNPNEIPSTLIGREMPELPEGSLVGYELEKLNEVFESSPVVLVNFFASWCGPCRAEHGQLKAISDEGYPIIGVNYKDQEQNATAFLNELGNPFIGVRVDDTGRNAIDWGVSGVPETFFVNQDGKVIKRHFGPITDDHLQNEILPFLAEQS